MIDNDTSSALLSSMTAEHLNTDTTSNIGSGVCSDAAAQWGCSLCFWLAVSPSGVTSTGVKTLRAALRAWGERSAHRKAGGLMEVIGSCDCGSPAKRQAQGAACVAPRARCLCDAQCLILYSAGGFPRRPVKLHTAQHDCHSLGRLAVSWVSKPGTQAPGWKAPQSPLIQVHIESF